MQIKVNRKVVPMLIKTLCHENKWTSGGMAPPFIGLGHKNIRLASFPGRFNSQKSPDTDWVGGCVRSREGAEAIDGITFLFFLSKIRTATLQSPRCACV